MPSAPSAPYDDRNGSIWFDGVLRPWREANLHVLSHGLHYASAVFEGERVYGGRIYKLSEHSERLAFSAGRLGFALPFSADEIDTASREVIRANGIDDGYVRPLAWRGSEMMGVSAQTSRIHVAISAWDWGAYFDPKAHLRGIALALAEWRRPAPQTIPTDSKAAGLYMICTLSKHKAEAEGFDDALMLDWRGRVAEATGANIFLVRGGELHTPTPDCFLDGITRRTVIGLARDRGIKIVERVIEPDEIATADEVFLTGTAAEVTPVRQIGDHHFHVGPLTRQMIDDYAKEVRK